jgi:flavin reductase (DIM6/NTAB) family NADH-FMN oxidoreductase RutF
MIEVSRENYHSVQISDSIALRSVFSRFATGITVVTANRTAAGSGATSTPQRPHGMTANSFTSVSLDPPLVLVCVLRSALMHEAIVSSGAFAISVLSGRQEHLARYFASHHRPRDEHEFDLVEWAPGRHTGAPLVLGALAWLECRLAATYDGGDHSIFVGSVLDIGRGPGQEALLFFGGEFHRFDYGAAGYY